MDEREWLRRYRQRLVDRGGLTPEQAVGWGLPFDFHLDESPEDAADNEISHWDE